MKKCTLGSLKDLKKCNNNNIDCDNHPFDEDHGIADRKEKGCPQEGFYTAVGKDKCPQNGNAHQKQQNNGKKCCGKGGSRYSKKKIEEDDHIEEPRFEEFDEEICRDPYCRIHKRSHGVTPVSDRPPMYWDCPPPFRNDYGDFFDM
ncbi:hypothetical protein LIER_40071 [Lithospermum erythrorhizon]|uniref:Uncharacterized protein n=1 Tax=Lithospermum erythrorhizon TaxID=34254 RepID=A0AAV3QRL1_LITER